MCNDPIQVRTRRVRFLPCSFPHFFSFALGWRTRPHRARIMSASSNTRVTPVTAREEVSSVRLFRDPAAAKAPSKSKRKSPAGIRHL